MGTSKDILIDEVYDLKEKLRVAKESAEQLLEENKDFEEQLKNCKEQLKSKVTYIHETSHLYCSDGELHIQYGDYDNENWVVYNTDQLFKDLPFIINQVVKENKKMQDYYLDQIKKELKEL